MKYKVGDRVINKSFSWNSGIKPIGNEDCKRGSICGNLYTSYCCDYKSNHDLIGIKGTIVLIQKDKYLVNWDDDLGLCGKPESALDFDPSHYRDIKLRSIGI